MNKKSTATDTYKPTDFTQDQQEHLIEHSQRDLEALQKRVSVKSKFKSKKSSRKKQVSSSCACFVVSFVIVFKLSLNGNVQITSLISAVFSLIATAYVVGFAYSLFLLMLAFFVLAIYRMYSQLQYRGLWCDLCFCLTEGKCRGCLRGFCQIVFVLLSVLSIVIIVIQIMNLVRDPKFTYFPIDCPDYSTTGQYCIRIANNNTSPDLSFLSPDTSTSFNLHNGLIEFKNTILECVSYQNFQARIIVNNDMFVYANIADPVLGFAYDFTIQLQQCQGVEYSVFVQSQARYKFFLAETMAQNIVNNFYTCLSEQISEQYHLPYATCRMNQV